MSLLLSMLLLVLQSPAPVRVYIHASRPTEGFIGTDQREREDSAKDLTRAMAQRFAPQLFVRRHPPILVVPVRPDADVIVDVTSRQATGDTRIVRATLRVGEAIFPIEGSDDDGDWSDAAKDLGKRIASWIMDNRTRIRQP